MNPHDGISIALWGPPGSGKTWLLDAFVAWVYGYNAWDEKTFDFSLRTFDGLIVPLHIPHPIGPTRSAIDRHFFSPALHGDEATPRRAPA